jgi:NTE family protein
MSLENWDIHFDIDEANSLTHYRLSDSLVVSGGGMKGLYMLGALEYLYQEVGISHLKSFYGVSIGAVICTLVQIGYTPLEVMAQICVQKIPQKIAAIDKNVMERKSLLNPDNFLVMLDEMISNKLQKIPTLKELYEITGKDLYITTICFSSPTSPLYLHYSTHPDIPISKAIHLSMSIPFIFGYAEYDGKRYMDGGILDNFPILYASPRSKRVFGLCMKLENDLEENTSFLNEAFFIITLPISYITESAKRNCPRNVTFVELDVGESVMGSISFSKNDDAVYSMFSKGYQECKKSLSHKQKKD